MGLLDLSVWVHLITRGSSKENNSGVKGTTVQDYTYSIDYLERKTETIEQASYLTGVLLVIPFGEIPILYLVRG